MKAPTAISVLLLVVGCQTAPAEMSELEIAQIEAEVMRSANDMMAAWNAEDGPSGLAFFDSETLRVFWGPDEFDSWGSFGEMWARIWEYYTSWDGGWDDSFVKVLSPTSALFMGRYHFTGTNQEGVKYLFEPHWTTLFERRADGWRMTVVDNAYGTPQELPEGG